MKLTAHSTIRVFLCITFFCAFIVQAMDAGVEKSDLRLTQQEKNWLADNKEISIGVDKHWYPFEFVDERGNHQGIAADYLKFAEYILNVEFKMVPTKDWGEAYKLHKLGAIDLLPAIIETENRLVDTLFTRSYFTTPTVIVSRKNSFYADSIESLEGKTLALVKGFAIVELVKKNNPEINLLLVDSIKAGLTLLEEGRVDAYIGAIAGINTEINRGAYQQLIISAFTPYELKVSMAASRQKQPLLSILNKVFASMGNRHRASIANTWLSVHVKQGISLQEVLTWGVPPFALLTLVVVIIFRLNRGLKKEVSRRKKVEKRLKHLAHHDSLTGLPNRKLFHELAYFSIAKAKREGEKHAILFIDIDGFKSVNDIYGHHIGDELLIKISSRLTKCIRASDIAARQGGDEFLILLNDNVNLTFVKSVASKLIDEISRVYNFENDITLDQVGASIGISIYPDHGELLTDLVKFADFSMYEAKKKGKNQFVLYNDTLG